MLHQAYDLCDQGEPLESEKSLLNNALIANGYRPSDVDQITLTYEKNACIWQRNPSKTDSVIVD